MHRLTSDGTFSPTVPKNFRDYDMFLAKQQMAEFFTAELHLIGEKCHFVLLPCPNGN